MKYRLLVGAHIQNELKNSGLTQLNQSCPPNPPNFGETGVQRPPEFGDLGGKCVTPEIKFLMS